MSERPRDFYTAGYSLADRAEADRLGRWRALGARSKADHAVPVRPRRRCGRGRWWRSAAATARCWPSSARAASRRCSTASSSRRPRPSSRGRARSPARGGSRPTTASTSRRTTAPTTSRCSRTCSSTSEHPAPLLREAARVAPAVLVEVPLEDNRSAGRPAKRAEAARIGHIQFLDRAAVHALVRGAGLRSPPSSPTPSPTPTTRSSPPRRPRQGARGAEGGRAARRSGGWRRGRAERLFTVHYACLARRR